jgi:protein SCO1/2
MAHGTCVPENKEDAMQLKLIPRLLACLCLTFGLVSTSSVAAQGFNMSARVNDAGTIDPVTQTVPELTPGVLGAEIKENLGAQLPLDATFYDETGQPVRLGDFFGKGRPVVVTMVYYECPQLCNLILNGMAEALKAQKLEMGKDYEVVTISFVEREKSPLALRKKANYLKEYAIPGADKYWHFLTGKEAQINQVCDVLGFGYRYNPANNEYLHQAGIYFVTEKGVVSRLAYGVEYETGVVRDSLLLAGEGKVGSPLERFFMNCGLREFNHATGMYSWRVWAVMQFSMLAVVAVVALWLGRFWYREFKKNKALRTGPVA